ncbi:MAG TPA: hypothetical protein PLF01_00445 [Alphaproteobacteria bacterium]|nr:hypothetical protein [Alphaproteobacteria bacterium]
MDVRNSSTSLDRLLLQLAQTRQSQNTASPITAQVSPPDKKPQISSQDLVTLSKTKAEDGKLNPQGSLPQNGTRLTAEEIDKLENGFRRTQKFETADGRKFTRVEEVTSEQNRSKRIVLQQNNSGSTTLLENIIDRQNDGTFRLTQRYTDENGETKTNIEFNVTPESNDIILGRIPDPAQINRKPFEPLRGTQLDLSA